MKAAPRVVCACNIVIGPEGKEYRLIGPRHFSPDMHQQLNILKELWEAKGYTGERLWEHSIDEHQGFIDQFGNYLTRQEAWVIANSNGQIFRRFAAFSETLYSEHLY